MPVTLDDLTVNFEHVDRTVLLDDWQWLIGNRRLPILITAIGDAFVEDIDDGSVYILSSGEGSFERVADSGVHFKSMLSDGNFVRQHFAPSLVVELRKAGQALSAGQLYGYKVPPRLGGSYAASNLEPTDIEVHFSIIVQLQEKIRYLPPGTSVSGISIK